MTPLAERISTRTRPLSKVLLAGGSRVGEMHQRDVVEIDLPIGKDWTEAIPQIASQDAQYLVLTGNALAAIRADPETAAWLRGKFPIIVGDSYCHIYELDG
jgi:hypothetical protein